jgi:hypothetical protein
VAGPAPDKPFKTKGLGFIQYTPVMKKEAYPIQTQDRSEKQLGAQPGIGQAFLPEKLAGPAQGLADGPEFIRLGESGLGKAGVICDMNGWLRV